MSTLLVDDLIMVLPTGAQAGGWRHVERGPQAHPHLVAVPTPVRTRAVGETAPLRLTDRGIAVVVGFFLAVVAIAALVLVSSFLSVSNEPIPAGTITGTITGGQLPALVVSQG